MPKKIIILSTIFLTIIIIFGLVFFIKPNPEHFKIEVITDKVEYRANENIHIQVKLKNNSMGCYKATFLNEKINLIISKDDHEVALTLLAVEALLLPYEVTTKKLDTTINEPGVYQVIALANFTIKGERIIVEESININVL